MGSKADATSGLFGAVGSAIGYGLSAADRQKAAEDYQKAINAYGDLDPNVSVQRTQAANQGSSAYNSMQMDPASRQAQMAALDRLQQIYSKGGNDAQTKAETAAQQAAADQHAQALNGQIHNAMAQRGLSSSGANFAAQRSNAQAAANTSNLAGLNALASGQSRALQALMGSGQLANQVRGQDYTQASNKAAANDAISRFNAQNQTQNNQFNSGLSLQAQEDTARNALARAQGLSGGYDNQAANYAGNAQKTQQMAMGGGEAVGGVVGAGADQADEAANTVLGAAGSGGGGGGGGGGLMSIFGSL